MPLDVVCNSCYGEFGLSKEGLALYNEKRERAGLPTAKYGRGMERHDNYLVEVVKELGKAANGSHADLYIDTIGDEYLDCYTIDEYEGLEKVVCDSRHLVSKKLEKLDVDALSADEAKMVLKDLKRIIKNPIKMIHLL